jgi:hypothetical protein
MKLLYEKVIDKLANKESKNRRQVEGMIPTDSESMKKSHLSLLLTTVPKFANILADKVWVVLENDTDSPLWTSDNPLTLSNSIDYGPYYGNLGLLCRGLEISFPLTPKLCLYSFDPKSHKLRGNDKKMNRDNIVYHNRLQVQKSTRYVFSKTHDFDLAEGFLTEYPQYRDPYRQRGKIY